MCLCVPHTLHFADASDILNIRCVGGYYLSLETWQRCKHANALNRKSTTHVAIKKSSMAQSALHVEITKSRQRGDGANAHSCFGVDDELAVLECGGHDGLLLVALEVVSRPRVALFHVQLRKLASGLHHTIFQYSI